MIYKTSRIGAPYIYIYIYIYIYDISSLRVKQANSPFEGALRDRVGGVAKRKVAATEDRSLMIQTVRQIFV